MFYFIYLIKSFPYPTHQTCPLLNRTPPLHKTPNRKVPTTATTAEAPTKNGEAPAAAAITTTVNTTLPTTRSRTTRNTTNLSNTVHTTIP